MALCNRDVERWLAKPRRRPRVFDGARSLQACSLTTAYRATTSCASELGWATCIGQDSPARSHIAGPPPPDHCQRAPPSEHAHAARAWPVRVSRC